MNNNKFAETLNTLNHLMEHPEKISMSQLQTLLVETLNFFESIRDRLTSEDSTIREKAMGEAGEMQEKLNQIASKMYEKTGLTKEKAEQIISNPNNFKKEDWELMKGMEKELGNFQKSV